MSSYGRKLLGLVQSRGKVPRTPLSNLSNMEIPISSPRPKYDMAHIKNFLESVKTPAEFKIA
jgi:hypothetical protein